MAALMVEHLKVLISRAPKGPYGRAPKGDGGLNSRACLRIQFTYWVGGLMVEHLKVMAALSVEPACASLSVEPPKGSLLVERAYAPCRSSPSE